MFFASDNSSAAHPKVLEAVAAANTGYAMPYGNDPSMDRARDMLREVLEAPEAAVYLVATGTAANALSVACYCQPWTALFCHRNAHVEEDECGAPEFYTGGAKLVLVEGDDARMTPDTLREAAAFTATRGVHNVQRGMVSVTNATEAGTVYTPDEVAALCDVAHGLGMPVHMDGARLANALVSTGATPAEMTWKAGIDILSFGGTKNGCLGVEAVVLFDPEKAWEFELRRKRGGHLFSKNRFLSAQIEGYLADGLWLETAAQANAMARRLSDGIAALPGTRLLHPTQANGVFAAWPRSGHRRAQEAGATYYLWPSGQTMDGPDDEAVSARMICSWSTTESDVDAFLDLIRG